MPPTRSRSFLALVVSAIALAAPLRAQLVEAWVRTDTTVGAHSLAVDAQGRSLISGASIAGSFAGVMLRDANGATTWSRTFDLGPATAEYFTSARFTPNGDVVVLGSVQNAPGAPFQWHALLARYDALGALLWSLVTTTPPTGGFENAGTLAIAPNGDIVVCGSSAGATPDEDATVWRVNPQGTIVWRTHVAGVAPRPDFLSAIAFAANGDVVVAGSSNFYASANSDVLVARLSSAGALLWSREMSGGAGEERANSLALDAAGRIVVAAQLVSGTSYDARLLVYDAAGTLALNLTTGLPWSVGTAAHVDSRGNFLLLAHTRDPQFVRGFELRKYDPSGALLWSRARAESTAHGCFVEPGDDVVVYGAIDALPPNGLTPAIRYDRDGALRWETRTASPGGVSTGSLDWATPGPGTSVYGFRSTAFQSNVHRLEHATRALCFGDGSGTPCPCGNASDPLDRSGCRHSLGFGVRLASAGHPRLAADTLVLDAASVPDSSVLFFQGSSAQSGGAGSVFGDGLRCAGGAIVRIATRTAALGTARYPAPGDPSISSRGLVTAPGTRWYQAWFRNSASFCTPATFNTTNGVAIDWSV